VSDLKTYKYLFLFLPDTANLRQSRRLVSGAGLAQLLKGWDMARRRSSFGLFGVFGRSEDLRALDQALLAAGLHPALVPDAVKLTVLNLLKDARGEDPSAQDYRETAALLGYCALGREVFSAANSSVAASAAEHRIEAALEAGEGFDASLILLALHAVIIHPDVKESFQFESV
jgi:hypothetical protein